MGRSRRFNLRDLRVRTHRSSPARDTACNVADIRHSCLDWTQRGPVQPADPPVGGRLNPAQDGPVRLLLIADTHIPSRARELPAQVWDEVGRADVVFHAGDWVTL